jgi:hypothetical protein
VLAVLAVGAAHVALWLWWQHAERLPRAVPATASRVAVRLVAPRPPAAPPEATPAAPPTRAAARETAARRRSVAAPSRPDDALPAPAPLAMTAPPPQTAASQAVAEPPPSLMDGDATRRAIRAAAREPGLAAMAGRQGPALQAPDERLGEQVQRSAKGDCLKGEYLGGGMGLLSLPFLAAAALRDQCRR